MHLTVLERQALIGATTEGSDEIEATLQCLQIVNAAAFHTLSALATHVFFGQSARNEPCLAYVRAHQPKGDRFSTHTSTRKTRSTASINKVIIVGNLGADSETCHMPSGDAATNIRVATTNRYRDKASDETKEATEWHHTAFFGRLAETTGGYLKEGSQVYIEDRLKTRQWEKDGQRQYSTEVVADQLQMLGEVPGDHGMADINDFESEGEIPP